MITLRGIELDFDITSPTDVMRYKTAIERMQTESEGLTAPTVSSEDPNFLDEYAAVLNSELRAFGNFIDDLFGDGVAEQLLSNNPSLSKVYDIVDALNEAMEVHGKEFEIKLNKYTPNRAARRAMR